MQPVACPQCKNPTDLSSDNPWRPFCSERCKLIDLGEWFEESRAIPAEEADDWSDGDDAGLSRYQ